MPQSHLEDKLVDQKLFDKLNIASANMALLFSLPFFFLFSILGNEGKGVAASISVGMMVLVIRMRWELKGHLWFWGVVFALILLHIPLVIFIHWSSSNLYSRVVLLPGALLDFFVIYNIIRLFERIFSESE